MQDLEKDDIMPIYRQLARALEQRIYQGDLKAGEKLDSEVALCKRFDISRVTARLAIDELVKKGLVERKQGKGTYVFGSVIKHEPADLNQFFDSIFAHGSSPQSELLVFERQRPPDRIAGLFGLEAGHALTRMERLYLLDNQKLGFGKGWLPLEVSRLPRAEVETTSSARLLANMGFVDLETEIEIGADSAGERAAHRLDLKVRSPVVLVERSRFLPDGKIVEHVRFTMNPALYKFQFRTR